MKRVVALLIPLALGGCVVASEKPDFDTRLIVASSIRLSETGRAPAPLAAPSPCVELVPSQPLEVDRNACIYRVKNSIDDSYLNYRLHIAKEVGLTNEGLDVGSVTSSAAATATTGVAAKVLSGLATTLTGARTAFNNDALYQQSLQAIFKQMEADRLSIWANIQISMQLNLSVYSMAHAENDLLAYFRAGTIEDALNSLDANAGTAQTTCKAASNAVGAATTASAAKAADTGGDKDDTQRPKLRVQASTPVSNSQQPAATTITEQCSQIIASANKVLVEATVKTVDVFGEEAMISKNIKSVTPSNKAELDEVANALGAAISSDYATERSAVLMALRNIDDADKLAEAAIRIQTATGQDFTK